MADAQSVETVEQLKALVGQELGVGAWVEITQERVNAFADVTGDHQYIHVDPERAQQTPYGGTIAHGFLTLSLLPLLGAQREGVQVNLPRTMSINYGLNRVRFPAPVPVGKRIRLHTKLHSVEEIEPKVLQIVYQQTVEVEGSSKPAMVAETVNRTYLA